MVLIYFFAMIRKSCMIEIKASLDRLLNSVFNKLFILIVR